VADPRTQIVADGYDAIGETFAAWRDEIVGDPRNDWEDAFVCSDFTELELPAGSVDGVIAFYTLNHVPRELLAPLLASCHDWLAPDGVLCVAFGTSDNPGWTGEWLGAETFFASYLPEVNSRLVRDAGFRIERDEVVEFEEPEGPARFQWVLAQA